IAASRFAVHQAQDALIEVCRERRVELALFHGRGDAASRGGSRVESLVRSAPPGAVRRLLRVTEQGEGVNNNYGLAQIAMRTFEQAFHQLAIATAAADAGIRRPEEGRYLECMGTVARASRARYRGLVLESAGFFDYFRAVTPIDVIERMQIGSRPAYRDGRMSLESLHAVPWVFAWTQSRHLLPGWFGIGTGLGEAAREHGAERLATMWSNWEFFSLLIDDVELELAKVDLGIAALYDELAPAGVRGFAEEIAREHALACRWVTWLKGEVDLLDSQARMQRSVMLRSPYLDPIHLMQVDLLRRWRQGGREDDGLFRALLGSITGVAQGLQSSG
ncbi:MAG: phosphoenolpyruvate carboxylase, partial [Gammaproteobacteria bacterium]|nr:phosphoenolpyruvate carboxylase [Gammaproteobacteria bacterium]